MEPLKSWVLLNMEENSNLHYDPQPYHILWTPNKHIKPKHDKQNNRTVKATHHMCGLTSMAHQKYRALEPIHLYYDKEVIIKDG